MSEYGHINRLIRYSYLHAVEDMREHTHLQ